MASRIPTYKYELAKDLPPYQLFKRWQKATGTKGMTKFGAISRAKMLADIKKYKPMLLKQG